MNFSKGHCTAFGQLQPALIEANLKKSRVWATDRYQCYDVITENGTKKKEAIVKRFWVSRLYHWDRFLRYSKTKRPNAYEIIEGNVPCKLYLDIEFKCNDDDLLTEERAADLLKMIRQILLNHLKASFTGLINEPEILILHSCSEKKFSLHIICPNVVFDNSRVSMLSYVEEFRAYIGFISKRPVVSGAGDDYNWVIAHCTSNIVDISVYKKNQQFRLVGNTKQNQNSPLRPPIYDPATDCYRVLFDPGDWSYSSIVPTMDLLKKYLVNVNDDFESCLSVKPSPYSRKKSHLAAIEGIYYLEKLHDCMKPEGRFLTIENRMSGTSSGNDTAMGVVDENDYDDRRKRLKKQKNDELITRKLISGSRSQEIPRGKEINFIDDDLIIMTEDGSKKKGYKLAPGDIVCCPNCDIVEGQLFGTPSAKVFSSHGGEIGYHCFNCECTTWLLATADQYGFTVESEEELIKTPFSQLNEGGRKDVDFNMPTRMFVLDGPMGCGKTHIAREYLENHPEATVLAITFRISLAQNLATRYNLHCYRSPEGRFQIDSGERCRRMVVCLDSLWRVPFEKYDIVVLDEATFIRHHFVSGTILSSEKMNMIIWKMRKILNNAAKIIIMQYRLTDACIDFYASLADLDPNDQVVKRKLDRPPPLHPLKVSVDLKRVTATLIDTYIRNFDPTDGLTKVPIVVFCTKATYASFLVWLLKHAATCEYGASANVDRIKGIWSSVQDDEWNQKFLKSPNTYAHEADVLIVTSVVQAGHSFDLWFKISFNFLFVGVLSHREELQLVSRLRILRRMDLMEHNYAYIQPGRSNTKIASLEKLKRYIEIESVNTDTTHFLTSVLASVRSERADSFNRHKWLWTKQYREANVSFFEDEDIPIHDKYGLAWIATKIKLFTTHKTSSIKKYLISSSNPEENLLDILEESNFEDVRHLTLLQIQKLGIRLEKKILCDNVKKGYHCLISILDIKNIESESELKKKMNPMYALICFLDYFLYMHPHIRYDEDRDLTIYHRAREDASHDFAAGLVTISFAKMIYDMLKSCGIWIDNPGPGDSIAILHTNRWSHAPQRETLFEIARKYSSAYALVIDKKLEVRSKKQKITANFFLSHCLSYCNVHLEYNKKNIPRICPKKIIDTLCALKCILQSDHFASYKHLTPMHIWTAVDEKFNSF